MQKTVLSEHKTSIFSILPPEVKGKQIQPPEVKGNQN